MSYLVGNPNPTDRFSHDTAHFINIISGNTPLHLAVMLGHKGMLVMNSSPKLKKVHVLSLLLTGSALSNTDLSHLSHGTWGYNIQNTSACFLCSF